MILGRLRGFAPRCVRQEARKWGQRRALIAGGVLLPLHGLDAVTTHIGLQYGAVEANPLMAGLMGCMGEAATYAAKLLLVLLAVALLLKLGKSRVVGLLSLATAAIVSWNVALIVLPGLCGLGLR